MAASRILFWSELFWPHIGGAEISGLRLITGLRDRGYEVVVVTRQDRQELPAEEQFRGFPVHRIPFWTAYAERDLTALIAIRNRITRLKKEFAPDVVHMNTFGPSILMHFDTQAAHKTLFLATIRNNLPDVSASHTALLGKTVRAADWVTSVSRAVLDGLRSLAPEIGPRSSVIYNGFDIPSISPAPPPDGPPTLLCLGRLAPQKGLDVALDAFATVLRRFPKVRLVLAGDGPLRSSLQEQATRLKIEKQVEFRGWIPWEETPSLLNDSTLIVLASRHEGLPRVAVEGALMERPVVGTRVDGIPEAVADGETGLVVEAENPDALAEAIMALLADPDKARKMGQAGRRRAEVMFGLERCISEYDQLYQSLTPRASNSN